MGTGSSALPPDNDEDRDVIPRNHNTRKSIRQQFHKEFGKSVSEENKAVSGPELRNDSASTNAPQSSGSSSGSGAVSSRSRALSSLENGESSSMSIQDGSPTHSPTQTSERKVRLNAAVFRARSIFMKPIIKTRPAKDKLVVKKQCNHALLKEMYRRMDPTLNTSTRPVVGEIELAAKFKNDNNTLLVKVGRGKNLSKEEHGGSPDPYVTVDLLQTSNADEVTTCQTKVKSSTCNPYFQEILMFQLSPKHVASTKLRISVWDKINATSNAATIDDFLGESLVELCKLDLNAGGVMWYKLYPRTDLSISGDVEVCLTFKEPNFLTLKVVQASGLKVCNVSNESSNPYVRLYVTGLPNKFETNVQSNTLNPVWNEKFDLDVHSTEFARRIIVLNVMTQSDTGGRDHRLGDVHIPLLDFNSFDENKKYLLEDLQNTPHSRSKWSEEGVAMEFREAMKAHMIYGYPRFFFNKQHAGKVMVSCHSKKAQTEAKMVIRDGIPSIDQLQM